MRLRFQGSHTDALAQYRRLLTRIAQEGMQIAGLSCEIAPIDYGITNGTEQVVPENCIPVRRP